VDTPKIELTYFDIEGAGEPVRLALLLSGTDFKDNRIQFGDWKDLKPKTPYGKLPLMTIDGGSYRTQSMAMLRWVGSTCSETLYPRDKIFEIEEAIGLVDDVSRSWSPCFGISLRPQNFGYAEGFGKTDEGKALTKKVREEWVAKELPVWFKFLEEKLDKNDWLAGGDHPSIADCFAIPFLRGFTRGHIDHVPTSCLDDYPNLVAYIKRFCALTSVKGRYTNGIY